MITAVYDRTQSDVDRVRELTDKYLNRTITESEKREWAGNLKGALNVSDLNRVESNCAIVAAEIAVAVSARTWQRMDIPRQSDYKRIQDNVERIRAGYMVLSDTPETPTQPLNTYQKWNDIERILYDVDAVYTRIQNSVYYSGEIYADEEIGVI